MIRINSNVVRWVLQTKSWMHYLIFQGCHQIQLWQRVFIGPYSLSRPLIKSDNMSSSHLQTSAHVMPYVPDRCTISHHSIKRNFFRYNLRQPLWPLPYAPRIQRAVGDSEIPYFPSAINISRWRWGCRINSLIISLSQDANYQLRWKYEFVITIRIHVAGNDSINTPGT